MSASKSNYPSRPPARSLRPKKPNKGQGRPSSHKGARKSQAWLSARDKVDGSHRDVSTRLSFAWWKAPMFVEARTKKWARLSSG